MPIPPESFATISEDQHISKFGASRRDFMVQGIAGIATVAISSQSFARPTASPQWGMIIDLNRCTGCQSCVIACKAQNDTAPYQFNTKIITAEKHNAPILGSVFTPIQCNHCENPPCVDSCSNKALFKLPNGIVAADWNLCTGLLSCVTACPYDALHADKRYGNRIDKCDFCQHRLDQELLPACVTACGSGARLFGDMNAPKGEFAEYLQRGDLVSRKPELKLTTRVRYIPLRNAKIGGIK